VNEYLIGKIGFLAEKALKGVSKIGSVIVGYTANTNSYGSIRVALITLATLVILLHPTQISACQSIHIFLRGKEGGNKTISFSKVDSAM
jgi:hypothetical protein